MREDPGDHFAYPDPPHLCGSCGHDDQRRAGPMDCPCCWRDHFGRDVRPATYRALPFARYTADGVRHESLPLPLNTDAGDVL